MRKNRAALQDIAPRGSWLLYILAIAAVFPCIVATAPAEAVEYWYDGDRRVPIRLVQPSPESLQGGRVQGTIAAFRASESGPEMLTDGTFYVCYPNDWDESRITALEANYRLIPSEQNPLLAGVRMYKLADPVAAVALANRIYEARGVRCAAPVWQRPVQKRSLPTGGDPLFNLQWHLENRGQGSGMPGADINALPAWAITLGQGITIAVLDDGLDIHHPDLVDNALPSGHFDFINNLTDPTAGRHGTAVAGIAAARGFNNIGGRGVAPAASLLGIRILDDSGLLDDYIVAQAFSYATYRADIVNNSWGPPDGPLHAFEGPSPLVRGAIENGIRFGRQGRGNIYVFAAGNGGADDDSNLDGYATLRYSIPVSATNNLGRAASYSEAGANILVNAPSSGGTLNMVTTDRLGVLGYNTSVSANNLADTNYTNSFTGTSGAAAVVSGVIALMLAANPSLNWREIQQGLAAGAVRNDPAHFLWRENGAGYWINEQYGFGRVEAANAVTQAISRQEPIRSERQSTPVRAFANRTIPDNTPAGISSSLLVQENLRIEHVEVTVNIPDHTYWGDLTIYLTSPAGTTVRLAKSHFIRQDARSLGYHNWTLASPLLLGESSKGTWTLQVVDDAPADTGTLESWSIIVYGTSLPATIADLPTRCDGKSLRHPETVRPAAIAQGVSRHGGPFRSATVGSVLEDYGVVATIAPTEDPLAMWRFSVAVHEGAGGVNTWYMRLNDGWHSWDGNLSALRGFAATGQAPAIIYQGRLVPGRYSVMNGYGTADGDIIYCPEPLMVTVM